jgi:outer membrane protein OmpA-like peptidoglycan-associated protein/tetratricopeptide (TPR) repeat protein
MKTLIFLFSFGFILSLRAQDPCTDVPTGKALKFLEQSRDTKKYDSEQRMELVEKCIEVQSDCMPCLMRKGEMLFLLAKRSNTDFAPAKQVFETIAEKCPEFHSEVYYFLGAMHYADKEYTEALKAFDAFLRFPDTDPGKFERDYDKKYKEVEGALPTVKAYAEIYKDPADFKPVKVSGVSSNDDDYLPIISPDGEIMFYTRAMQKQSKGDVAPRMVEEFTWSLRPDINASFDAGKALPKPFNVGDNYGGATISVDNRELIIARKNPKPKAPQNVDLFSTTYSLTTDEVTGKPVYIWSPLVDLGPSINTDEWEAQPSLSGDGQYLFFVTYRVTNLKDASGNPTHDLYYSKKEPDGSWATAQPLPASINTSKQEKTPFMHSDSKTLYFSSDGHTGVGGMDVFYCKMNDDGSFTTPKNIGYPINSEADELGIVVSSDGELAYFGARNFRGDKGWNVYQFHMPEKARPEKVMILKGVVKNDAGQPGMNASVEIKYAQSQQVEKVKVNLDDGAYAAVVKLSKKEDVVVSVQGEGVAFNTRVIARKEDTALPVVSKLNMEVPKEVAEKPVVINDILYGTSKATLEEESKIVLNEFALYLIAHPTFQIEIRGHTDNIGDDAKNLALSKERAFEVLTYLSSLGVDAKRMSYNGFGKTKPVAANDTEEGRAKNRRTEFVIKKL